MAISRWEPFQGLTSLREAMDRLFEESFVRPDRFFGAVLGRAWAMPLDVYAEDDHYVIEAALPGLAPEAVNVSVLGNQVAISGEYPTPPENRRYLFRERPYGRFERTVTLPSELDPDHAEAHYEHGLLRLIVPKAAAARPKRIAITAGR
ncbi:MAG TPA: Hsp20/alpha crystallin family protein [Chloroflexota bacterium]|jgi:HSP20 family protein|nr:Hsp20/alpha crystallin family protein [Chloroflexota bacterium]